MRLSRYLLTLAAPLALFAGCEAYVHTDAPPSRVEVHSTPAPAPTHVDVNVNRKPGGVDVNVHKNP